MTTTQTRTAADLKEEREAEKLLLEIDELKAHKDLLGEKLRREIAELRRGPVRTFVTAALSAAIAIVGLEINATLQTSTYNLNKSASDSAALERELETYNRLISDVADNNSATRAGAVVGLTDYAQKPPRSEQTITILTNRLAVEDDPATLQLLVNTLGNSGQSGLLKAISANHAARTQLDLAFARYLGAKIELGAFANAKGSREAKELKAESNWHNLVDQFFFRGDAYAQNVDSIQAAVEGVLVGHSFERSGANVSEEYQSAILQLLEDRISKKEVSSAVYGAVLEPNPDINRNFEGVLKAVLPVVSTSQILSRLLTPGVSTDGSKLEFGRVAILDAQFADRNLSGATFEGAFLAGDAKGTDFRGADFKNANLRELKFGETKNRRTDMCDASLAFAALPPFDFLNSHGHALSDLTGADWWNSYDVALGSTFKSRSKLIREMNALYSETAQKDRRREIERRERSCPGPSSVG